MITISRGSYSRGKDVAEELARGLGYKCVSREILLDASEQFSIPEIKLLRGMHDAPSLFGLLNINRTKYVAYIQNALLKQVAEDNVVYHGLAGHFLLQGIPNILKVRILADMEYRQEVVVRRDNISAEKAIRTLGKDDEERRRWSDSLFGKDPWDPSLYDLIIHIGAITVEDAVDIISKMLKRPCFKMTDKARDCIQQRLKASEIKSLLISDFPTVEVQVDDGTTLVTLEDAATTQSKTIEAVKKVLEEAEVTGDIKIEVNPKLGIE